MVYLDYSATTPSNEEVLNTFLEVSKKYIGNPNSLHKLGFDAKKIVDVSTSKVAEILKVKQSEIIYTSGATEANNMAIYGVVNKFSNRGKHIITTKLEHSSINEPLKYLEGNGYKVSYVKLDNDGHVDLENLESLIDEETILVTISSVNSETGVIQNLNEINNIIKKYPKVIFHSDITQSVGKVNIDLSSIDLASFSAQKFYGIKGIGCLIKKEKIIIDPLIKGGKSTTVYRSGTPPVALIASLAKALNIAYIDIDKKYKYVESLNDYLRNELSSIKDIHINSNSKCIPHILNISIPKIKPETILHSLEEKEIYISTRTACSNNSDISDAVYVITKNEEYAKHSLRISLSYLTKKEEIDYFIKVLKEEIERLLELYKNKK